MGLTHPRPAQAAISRSDALRELWRSAGLDAVRTREITVARTFADFDDFWATALLSPTVRAALPAGASETLAQRLRMRSSPKASVPITLRAHANAISGQVS